MLAFIARKTEGTGSGSAFEFHNLIINRTNKSHNNQIYLADYLDKIYSRNSHMYHAHNLN